MIDVTEFSLVVFDLDGVLVRTDGVHALACSDLWRRLGLEGPEYSRIADQTTPEAVKALTARIRPSSWELATWVDFKQESPRRFRTSRLAPDRIPESSPKSVSASV